MGQTVSAPFQDCVSFKLIVIAVHFYLHGAGIKPMLAPMVLGHESCGVVTALGPNLPPSSTLQIGDRVALEVGVSCRSCEYCRAGRYNLCPEMSFAASTMVFPHRDGTLREVLCHPAELCYKLPPSLHLPLAALAEPLSVAINAFRRAQIQPGARVLVIGAGAVGLLTSALAKAGGCTTVVAVDIDQGKLDFATEKKWVTGTCCPERGPRVSGVEALDVATKSWETVKASEVVQAVEGLERGFDAVFECSGVESSMQMAVMVSRRRRSGWYARR